MQVSTTGLEPTTELAPFSLSAVFTEPEMDPFLLAATVSVAGLYLLGVWTMHRGGNAWPVGRTLSFVVLGLGSFTFATSSGLAAYDTALLSVHMVQHMLLSMVVPLLLALGAPVILALRTSPPALRSGLLSMLHSRLAKVLSFAPLTFALFVLSPWALYFTGWYDASLHSAFVHETMHVHLVLVGSLFFWPLVGVDPVPGRVDFPFRLLLIFLTLPFHAFLGVTIMSQDRLIAGDWYRNLPMSWLPSPVDDQHLAGGILWGSGDLIGLGLFGVLFVQWVRQSSREATREDRRLDRIAARESLTSTEPTGDQSAGPDDNRAER